MCFQLRQLLNMRLHHSEVGEEVVVGGGFLFEGEGIGAG